MDGFGRDSIHLGTTTTTCSIHCSTNDPEGSPNFSSANQILRTDTFEIGHEVVNSKITNTELNNAQCGGSTTSSSLGSKEYNTLDNLYALGMLAMDDMNQDESIRRRRFSLGGDIEEPSNRDSLPIDASPFEKWLKTLHRRAAHRKTTSCDSPRMVGELGLYDNSATQSRQGHRKSNSGSSFGFVTNMKSVGTSLASLSIAPRSRTGVSSRQQRTDFSSKASYAVRVQLSIVILITCLMCPYYHWYWFDNSGKSLRRQHKYHTRHDHRPGCGQTIRTTSKYHRRNPCDRKRLSRWHSGPHTRRLQASMFQWSTNHLLLRFLMACLLLCPYSPEAWESLLFLR